MRAGWGGERGKGWGEGRSKQAWPYRLAEGWRGGRCEMAFGGWARRANHDVPDICTRCGDTVGEMGWHGWSRCRGETLR